MKLYDTKDVTPEIFEEECILVKAEDCLTGIIKNIPVRTAGIYCFYDIYGNPLYFGQSVDVKNRVKGHLKGTSTPTKEIISIIHYVAILPVINCNYSSGGLLYVEKRLIEEIKPLFNGASRGVEAHYGYKNLRAELNQLSVEYEDIPKEILEKLVWDHVKSSEGEIVKMAQKEMSNSLYIPIESQKETLGSDEITREGERNKDYTLNNSSNISAVREAIKILLNGCSPGKQLDNAIDGILRII